MPMIKITDEAHQAILSKASPNFIENGHRIDSGEWMIPLQWDTLQRLRSKALEGESLSDTIIRCITLASNEVN